MQRAFLSALLVWNVCAAARGYVAHEWGTYTSVQGSDGKMVAGLWREEELLPGFVRGRGACHFTKCADFLVEPSGPLAVTQKLETPVLYFHAKEAQRVSVKVDFPEGIITQYYPTATAVAPKIGNVQAVANGSSTWDVNILTETVSVPSVPSGNVYAPARETSANYLSVGGENEKFIFYRGLGNFNAPFEVLSEPNGQMKITSHFKDVVPFVFLVRLENGRGEIKDLGAIAPGKSVVTPAIQIGEQSLPEDVYLAAAARSLIHALDKTSLNHDESVAMVNTWKKSYFLSPGLKVLYVAPRTYTDALLPITFNPAPEKLVRTLVGRVEVLLAAEEHAFLKAFKQAAQTGAPLPVESLGRFAEPKVRRLLAINTDPEIEKYVNQKFDFSGN